MNPNINDFLTNFSDDDLSGIFISDTSYHTDKYDKINVFNKAIKSPMHKIWIKTPKLKIFNNINPAFFNGNKNVTVSVLLSSHDPVTKKLYYFIKKLERKLFALIKDSFDVQNIKMKSSISSSPDYPPTFKLRLPYNKINDNTVDFDFHIYNWLNKRININSLHSGSFISSFIELSEIWINQDKFGFNWNVLQMKLYPQFDFSVCLFDDYVPDNNSPHDNNECYHCLYCPNKHVHTQFSHNCSSSSIPPPPPPIHSLPSTPSIPKKHKININKNKNVVNNSNNNNKPSNFYLSIDLLKSVKLRPINKSLNKS